MEICPKLQQIIARLTLRGKIREFEREMSEVVTEQNQMRLIWVFGDKTFSTLSHCLNHGNDKDDLLFRLVKQKKSLIVFGESVSCQYCNRVGSTTDHSTNCCLSKP